MSVPSLKLNSGKAMPALGFGTWALDDGREATEAVLAAIEAGYRLIDTAKIYGNEHSVGEAIRRSGIERREIFVTTKLWASDFESPEAAFEESLNRLGLEYIDLYLIHSPNGDSRSQAWRSLVQIYEQGRAKNIGVSNYKVEHLEELFGASEAKPAVNQIELHPFIYHKQRPVLDYCQKKGIVIEAYSPLAQAAQMDNEMIGKIAKKHDKTTAQVMLRWAIQHNTIPIPKSAHHGRINQNIDVFDFELSEADMRNLDSLG